MPGARDKGPKRRERFSHSSIWQIIFPVANQSRLAHLARK